MANVLAVPATVLSIITMILVTLLSEAVGNRSFVAISQNLVSPPPFPLSSSGDTATYSALTRKQWYFPGIVALLALRTITPWQYFGIATAFLGGPWVHAIQVGWCSRNSGSVRTRTVSAALYNMAIQTSGIIGANVYQVCQLVLVLTDI